MAAFEVKPDSGYGLRTELNPGAAARAEQEVQARSQQNETAAMVAFVVVAAIILVVAFYAVRHKRRIARAVDAAVIGGLATGVRAARAARSRRDGLIRRILAKADEIPPTKD